MPLRLIPPACSTRNVRITEYVMEVAIAPAKDAPVEDAQSEPARISRTSESASRIEPCGSLNMQYERDARSVAKILAVWLVFVTRRGVHEDALAFAKIGRSDSSHLNLFKIHELTVCHLGGRTPTVFCDTTRTAILTCAAG